MSPCRSCVHAWHAGDPLGGNHAATRRSSAQHLVVPTPLIVALLAVLAGLPTAQAQSSKEAAGQDPTTLDQVQVTGIRESMQSSINKKRDDTVIADVLSADDIGDLPAPSLADAIETLTGAASTRDKTGASEISIRGLGAFLSSTNFNGREITNGSGDRSVNFNMFPAELINTVAIYKTQRADIIEGGVAGTIGLETVRPLEYGKRAAQLDLRGSWAEYDKNAATTTASAIAAPPATSTSSSSATGEAGHLAGLPAPGWHRPGREHHQRFHLVCLRWHAEREQCQLQ